MHKAIHVIEDDKILSNPNYASSTKDDEPEPWHKGPIKIITILFLVLILILWIVPAYYIQIDPRPSAIPEISQVFNAADIKITPSTAKGPSEYYSLVTPNDPNVKQTADKLSTFSCNGNQICGAKTIFYFIRDKFNYVSDPRGSEYVKSPIESLVVKGGDCEDASILAVNLLNAIGIETRFVVVPNHVYVEAWLPEASRRYKSENDWVPLDLTCKNCEFGETGEPYKNKNYI